MGFPSRKYRLSPHIPPPVSSSSKTFLNDRSHRDPSLRSRMTRWEGRNVRKRRREGSRAKKIKRITLKSVGAPCRFDIILCFLSRDRRSDIPFVSIKQAHRLVLVDIEYLAYYADNSSAQLFVGRAEIDHKIFVNFAGLYHRAG